MHRKIQNALVFVTLLTTERLWLFKSKEGGWNIKHNYFEFCVLRPGRLHSVWAVACSLTCMFIYTYTAYPTSASSLHDKSYWLIYRSHSQNFTIFVFKKPKLSRKPFQTFVTWTHFEHSGNGTFPLYRKNLWGNASFINIFPQTFPS